MQIPHIVCLYRFRAYQWVPWLKPYLLLGPVIFAKFVLPRIFQEASLNACMNLAMTIMSNSFFGTHLSLLSRIWEHYYNPRYSGIRAVKWINFFSRLIQNAQEIIFLALNS